MGFFDWIKEKINPAQPQIQRREPSSSRSNRRPTTVRNSFRDMEIVNRGVNMLIDSCAEVDFDVQKSRGYTTYGSGIKGKTLDRLLNQRPNLFMDSSTFWRLVYMDFLLEGWAFIYYNEEEQAIYHLPAANMEVFADKKYYINHFLYDGQTKYKPNEIIFIKDNSFNGETSQISGYPRVLSALSSIIRKDKLQHFKEKFFDNGTVMGLIIETEQVLNKRLKDREREEIRIDHNVRNGKSNVLILDGGKKAKSLSATNLKELGIEEDLDRFDKEICKALGIPPILLEGGNNANIRPNIDLFYYLTILPIAEKFEKALEFFFGFDIKLDTSDIAALTPDREKESNELSSKVNNGIITGNEAREKLRLEPIDDPLMDKIRIPQNVAGSGTGVSGEEGGAPKKEDNS